MRIDSFSVDKMTKGHLESCRLMATRNPAETHQLRLDPLKSRKVTGFYTSKRWL